MYAFDYNQTYGQTLIELKSRIENDFGSVLNFCNATGIDRPNLVRAFSRSNDKDMSVGLYVRCAVELKLMETGSIGEYNDDAQLFNLTFRNYLKIDTIAVWRSMFFIATRQADNNLSGYDAAYNDTMAGLKDKIMKEFGSVSEFCRKFDFDRPNLTKILSPNSPKDMSVGLYIRCAVALGLMSASAVDDDAAQLFNLTLRNYLKLDTRAIWRSVLSLANPVEISTLL